MRAIIFLSVWFIISVIVELYTYSALRAAIASNSAYKTLKYLYILTILITLAGFIIVYVKIKNDNPFGEFYTNIIIGLAIGLVITKLFIFVILFAEDIFRVFKFIVEYIAGIFSEKGNTAALDSRRKFISLMALGIASIPFVSFVYGITKGKYNFKIKNIQLSFPDFPKKMDELRIVQISDLHLGSFDCYESLKKGFELIQEQKPDLILLTGDIVNVFADEIKPYVSLLSSLKATYGKFSVMGNHDYGEYTRWDSEDGKQKNLDRLHDYYKKMDFTLLDNQHRIIEKDGTSICVAGVENWGKPPFSAQKGDLNRALKGVDHKIFTVLLSHDPSHWDEKVLDFPKPIHLTLSGHTHGMQMGVNIPGFKWSLVKYFYKRWAGLYQKNLKTLYVNTGFGFIAFPGRVGFFPEITVFTLTNSES